MGLSSFSFQLYISLAFFSPHFFLLLTFFLSPRGEARGEEEEMKVPLSRHCP